MVTIGSYREIMRTSSTSVDDYTTIPVQGKGHNEYMRAGLNPVTVG